MNLEYDVGQTIIKHRKDKGWTQLELADRLGVSPKTVSKWESGNGLPDIGYFPMLADLFDVSIDYLMTGVEREPPKPEPIAVIEKIVEVPTAQPVKHRLIYTFLYVIIAVILAVGSFVGGLNLFKNGDLGVSAHSTNVIVYSANGGSGVMATQKFAEGNSVTLRANGFTREGFTFDGWAEDVNGQPRYEEFSQFTPQSEEPLTLYATWRPIVVSNLSADELFIMQDDLITGVTPLGKEQTRLAIPDNITRIGKNAFAFCTKLEYVLLPESMLSIMDNAFWQCINLKEFAYPKHYRGSLYARTFDTCVNLSKITLPDNIEYIPKGFFNGCINLKSVKIPQTVTKIDDFAFSDCSTLTEIVLPDNLKQIGEYAFNGCYRITEMDIPDGVTVIERAAFGECSSLKTVTMPEQLTKIGERAFSQCVSLTAPELPNSLEQICAYAFYNCHKLNKIVIPQSVKKVEKFGLHNVGDTKICCECTADQVEWENSWTDDYEQVVWNYKGG